MNALWTQPNWTVEKSAQNKQVTKLKKKQDLVKKSFSCFVKFPAIKQKLYNFSFTGIFWQMLKGNTTTILQTRSRRIKSHSWRQIDVETNCYR